MTRRLLVPAWTIVVAGGAIACAGGVRSGDAHMTDSPPRGSMAAPMPEGPVPSADSITVEGGGTGATTAPTTSSGASPRHDHQGAQSATPAASSHGSHSAPSARGGSPAGHSHTPDAPASGKGTSVGADGRLTITAPVWSGLSATAREQIAAVQRAVADFDTPAKARAAGFRPALGMIPTMGVHWVNGARMSSEVQVERPAHLMFSRVDGEDRLVGAAYAFIGRSAREAPDLFDGNHDVWHDHPEFAPEGQSLIMLHVWFVPSPHGPFAGHNPWLAYWAAGVQPPSASLLEDVSSARRVHRLALALAEHVEPMQFARYLQLDSAVRSDIASRRAEIGGAVPRLAAAQQRDDRAFWSREADAAIAHWQVIRDAYLAAVPQERARELLTDLYRQMESGHAH